MRGPTHALFGVTTLAIVNALIEFVQPHVVESIPTGPIICAGAAILGALAPDLDAEDSTIQHDLGRAGSVVRGGLHLLGVKHRGLLHSGLATMLILAVGWLVGWHFDYADVGLAFGLGYASHVFVADAMTRHGVPLWWPLAGQFHLLPKPLRMRTGGPAEALVFLIVALILLWMLPNLILPELLTSLSKR